MAFYRNLVFSVNVEKDIVSFTSGGCLRGVVSDITNQETLALKTLSSGTDVTFSKKSKFNHSLYSNGPVPDIAKRGIDYISSMGDESKIFIFMSGGSKVSLDNLKVWITSVNRNIGGLPTVGSHTVEKYFQNKPFEFKKTDKQFMMYIRASLYRMPILYPSIVNDFCRNYKKHKNFWLSLYAAHVYRELVGRNFPYSHKIFKGGFSGFLYALHLIRAFKRGTCKPKCAVKGINFAEVSGPSTGGFGVLANQERLHKHFRCQIIMPYTKLFSPLAKRLVRLGTARAIEEACNATSEKGFSASRSGAVGNIGRGHL